MKIEVHLPPQQLNHFVNGFMECLHRVWRYSKEFKIMQNGPSYMTEQFVSIWQKTRKYNFTYLYNSWTVLLTVFWSVFRECGGIRTSSISCKTDHSTWLSSWWAYGKKHKIQVHIPLQSLNRFVNSFVEHLQGVWRYPNESKITQNGPW